MPDSNLDSQFEGCVWTQNSVSECSSYLKVFDNNDLYKTLLAELEKDGFDVLRTNEVLKTLPLIGENSSQLLYRDSTHLSKFGSEAVIGKALLLKAKNEIKFDDENTLKP